MKIQNIGILTAQQYQIIINISSQKETYAFSKSMISFDKFAKNGLYRSHCPISSYPTSTNLSSMDQSLISAASNEKKNNLQHKQNKISYKYERVGNMFKLVQVKGRSSEKSHHSNKSIRSHGSDPKQQQIFEQGKIQRLNEAIQDLTNRIISLQLQQAKIPGIEKKLNQTASLFRGIESQGNYLSQKVTGLNNQITDIKERLEEIEQQGGSYEKQFGDIFKLMNEIKQETIKTLPETQKKYEDMIVQLRHHINNQIKHIQTSLKQHQNFTNKQFLPAQRSSPRKSSNPFINPFKTPSTSASTPKSYKLKYRQTYELDQSTYCITQMIYKVDKEGRLMDSSGFVLLDHCNREIKLNQLHLRKLRELGILCS